MKNDKVSLKGKSKGESKSNKKNKVSLKLKLKGKSNRNLEKKTKKIIKGGCDLPLFPDGDDVWERENGIKSAKIFSLLQFYKLIEWRECHEMFRFAKQLKGSILSISPENKLKKLKELKELETKIEHNITQALENYVLYDMTGQMIKRIEKAKAHEEYTSPSFIIGGTDINLTNGYCNFIQTRSDIVNNKRLLFTFNFYKSVHIIIKKKLLNVENKEKEISEIFFFSHDDAKFTLGFKGKAYTMPTTYINDKIKSAEFGRQQMLKNRTLTSNERIQQQIQSNSSSNSTIQQPKLIGQEL